MNEPVEMISLEQVESQARSSLMDAGLDEENAKAVADVIMRAERDGVTSHGLFRLKGYLAALTSGKVNKKARPHCKPVAPSILKVDGDGGFTPLAHQVMAKPLVEMAKKQGVAIAAVVNSHHFAALWPEIELLTDQGLIGMACTSYMPVVAAAGGTKPIYGTNPFAFGWPRPDGKAMIFDQASAVMARGDVMIAGREGRQLPPGVGIDAQGEPTTDPDEILKGAQLAYGGYKGASIAMMVELLAGPLIGEMLSFETAQHDVLDGGPPRGGEFILAIDPDRTGAEGNPVAHGERLFAELLKDPNVRLPGQRRAENRKRTKVEGVQVAHK